MAAIPFHEHGGERLAALVGRRLLCAFDFDGTLAPIVADPAAAQLPPGIRQQLLTLSMHAPLAVITGRSIADVRTRLGFEPDYIVGNHGLEGVPGDGGASEEYRRLCAVWARTLNAAFEQNPEYATGIAMENKGCSLSVHYRHAPDTYRTETWVRTLVRQLMPMPHLIGGKFVFNLLPQGAGDKGRALEQLLHASGAAAAVYAGDDVTDEDVFRLQRSAVLGVAVGRALETGAEYFVPQQQDISTFLEQLIDLLQRSGANNWLRRG